MEELLKELEYLAKGGYAFTVKCISWSTVTINNTTRQAKLISVSYTDMENQLQNHQYIVVHN